MPIHGRATTLAEDSDHYFKKPKSRQVSSRFLSFEKNGNYQSPNPSQTLKSKSPSSPNLRKQKPLEKSGFFRGLWPSSSALSPSPYLNNTLADCIEHDRKRDDVENRKKKTIRDQHPLFLNRQRSCTEFSRFDDSEKKLISKENHKPVSGGSMRYTGKLRLSSSNSSDEIVPGRFSVDENSLRRKPIGLSDSDVAPDSDSELSDVSCSFEKTNTTSYSYMASTVSSRKHGIEVQSRFLRDLSSKSGHWNSGPGPDQKSGSSENNSTNNSPKVFSLKKGKGDWASSPGRAGSPKGKLIGLANSKPPTSPSRGKGVGNILSLGIELLKGKKVASAGAAGASPLGPGLTESVHELRILQSRLMQWRYGNAKADAVNRSAVRQAERQLLHAWNALTKFHHSVLQKKLQLQKEKLEWKLSYILHSQIKALEMWGNIERQHSYAISNTKDCLHSVVCRIPLIDGAKVEPQTASMVVRHASDLAISINSMLTTFSPSIKETVGVLSELVSAVRQEKLMLEECLDLYKSISILEVQERSLKSSVMQLNILQQRHQQQYSLLA